MLDINYQHWGGFMITKLTSVHEGNSCIIEYILAEKRATKRLYEMGLHAGAHAVVKKNDGLSPLILGIHGASVAVGRRIAENIYVEVGDKND